MPRSYRPRIAITDDTRVLRCRLLIRLIRFCGGEPVLVGRRLRRKSVGLEKNDRKNIIDAVKLAEAKAAHCAQVRKLLESCDGVLIPGNALDVPPIAYGEEFIHPETARRLVTHPLDVRFDTDSTMALYALKERPMPILGVCGGMQAVNVVLGGSLIQHLPDDPRVQQGGILHGDPTIKQISLESQQKFETFFNDHLITGTPANIFPATHPMKVTENSMLASIYRSIDPDHDLNAIGELSIHHQGCFEEHLAKGLTPVALAPDGVIEAAEMPKHPHLCILTQFHWECNVSNIAVRMVEALVKAASKASS